MREKELTVHHPEKKRIVSSHLDFSKTLMREKELTVHHPEKKRIVSSHLDFSTF